MPVDFAKVFVPAVLRERKLSRGPYHDYEEHLDRIVIKDFIDNPQPRDYGIRVWLMANAVRPEDSNG